MNIKGSKLSRGDARDLFAAFYELHGPRKMKAAYSWDTAADAAPAKGEFVWAFRDLDHVDALSPLGWGTVTKGTGWQYDGEALMACGVFPSWERRGYRVAILEWMCRWARGWGFEWASTHTSHDNEAQYERKLRESERGVWQHAGEVWHPSPGYGIFVRDLNLKVKCECGRQPLKGEMHSSVCPLYPKVVR